MTKADKNLDTAYKTVEKIKDVGYDKFYEQISRVAYALDWQAEIFDDGTIADMSDYSNCTLLADVSNHVLPLLPVYLSRVIDSLVPFRYPPPSYQQCLDNVLKLLRCVRVCARRLRFVISIGSFTSSSSQASVPASSPRLPLRTRS